MIEYLGVTFDRNIILICIGISFIYLFTTAGQYNWNPSPLCHKNHFFADPIIIKNHFLADTHFSPCHQKSVFATPPPHYRTQLMDSSLASNIFYVY